MSDNARYQPGARGPPVHAPDPERDFVACQALYLHVQASAQRTQDLYMLTLLRKYFAPVTNGEAQFTHCCTTATGCQLIGALVNDLRGAERYYARREAALVVDLAHLHDLTFSVDLARTGPPFATYNRVYAAAHAFLTRLDAHDDIEMLNHLYQHYITMYTSLPAHKQADIYKALREWLTVRVENAVVEAQEQRTIVHVTHALVLAAQEIAGTLLPAALRNMTRSATEWLASWRPEDDPTEIQLQMMCLRWRNQFLLGLLHSPWIAAVTSHRPDDGYGGHGFHGGGPGQYGGYSQPVGPEQHFSGGHGGMGAY